METKETKFLAMNPAVGTPRTPLAPGVVIMLAELGCFLQVPELTLGQREDNEDLIAKFGAIKPLAPDTPFEEIRKQEREGLRAMAEIALIALRRNYPEIKIEAVKAFSLSELKRAVRYALAGPLAGEAPAAPAPSGLANGKAATA